MLATDWAVSKLVAIFPAPSASPVASSNETGMNVKAAGTAACQPNLAERECQRVQPVIPFLYHNAGSNDPTNNDQDEKLVMDFTDF